MITGLLAALWLGILTSISPCPLATNIAAISYLSKRLSGARSVLLAGLAYLAGRMFSYLAVAAVVVAGLLSIPGVSNFLQRYMNRALGPILIVTGIALLGWIRISLPGFAPSEKLQNRAGRGGIIGPFVLGAVFALTFCPVSAALFFGSLIPLALQHNSPVLLPSVYGAGTGLPVAVFAILIAFGVSWMGKAFNKLAVIEKWARIVTGVVFILVGIHYVLCFWFGIDVLQVFYR